MTAAPFGKAAAGKALDRLIDERSRRGRRKDDPGLSARGHDRDPPGWAEGREENTEEE